MYMPRTAIKVAVALFAVAVVWKVAFSGPTDADVDVEEYEPTE